MSSLHPDHLDNEDEVHDEKHVPQPVKSTFDDAFSDEDDRDVVPAFSPEAIREEFARSYSIEDRLSQDEVADFASKIGFSTDPYLSPPPVEAEESDLGEQVHSAPPTMQRSLSSFSDSPSVPSHQNSFYEVELSSAVSELNLQDRSPSPPSPPTSPPASPPAPPPAPYDGSETRPSAEYPSVYIDASQSRLEVREVHPDHNNHPNGSTTHSRDSSREDARARSVSPRREPRSAPNAQSMSVSHLPSSYSQPASTSKASFSHTAGPPAASAFRRQKAKSMGPSMLDKVISKTRPTFLPPKPRAEDRKHMADWEQMMKRSRAAGE